MVAYSIASRIPPGLVRVRGSWGDSGESRAGPGAGPGGVSGGPGGVSGGPGGVPGGPWGSWGPPGGLVGAARGDPGGSRRGLGEFLARPGGSRGSPGAHLGGSREVLGVPGGPLRGFQVGLGGVLVRLGRIPTECAKIHKNLWKIDDFYGPGRVPGVVPAGSWALLDASWGLLGAAWSQGELQVPSWGGQRSPNQGSVEVRPRFGRGSVEVQ